MGSRVSATRRKPSKRAQKSGTSRKAGNRPPSFVTLPPIDATPEEIVQTLFQEAAAEEANAEAVTPAFQLIRDGKAPHRMRRRSYPDPRLRQACRLTTPGERHAGREWEADNGRTKEGGRMGSPENSRRGDVPDMSHEQMASRHVDDGATSGDGGGGDRVPQSPGLYSVNLVCEECGTLLSIDAKVAGIL